MMIHQVPLEEVPPQFHAISDEQIEQCVRKAIMKTLPQLIEDEDIMDHIENELLHDNVAMLSQSSAIEMDDLNDNKSNVKLSFSALSNTKGEKRQQSLTLLINLLAEHLVNYDITDDDEKEIRQVCDELQNHLQNIRQGQYTDYGVNLVDGDDDDGAYVEGMFQEYMSIF